MYLTHIQTISLEILPDYQCIKGSTIESIVVNLFLLKSFIMGIILQYYVLFDLFYAGVHTRCAPIKEIYDSITLMCKKLPEMA